MTRTRPSFVTIVLAGWALTALMLVVTGWDAIVARRFADADDAMRLAQVRDWLGGQGWFDVAQHRLNHGDFPMHWSRLVDLPLAGTMLALRPLLGVAGAEQAALVIVPLLTLLVVLAMIAAIARRVGGAGTVEPAVLLGALAAPLLFQLRPLRIDHHGWQIALALVAVHALVGRPIARGGAVAGLALALLLTVSLEGLPIVAAIAGVAAIGWALQPRRGAFLRALGAVLAGAAVLLHAATRGPGFWSPACDAVAPAWLAVLIVAGAGVALAGLAERFGLAARLGALAVVAAAAGATLAALAPACLAGPFGSLPPLVYRIWYLSVLEGRPLWDQPSAWAIIVIAGPAVGLVGAGWQWRRTSGAARERWAMLLALLAAATVVAVFVSRAGATANALAAPPAGALLAALLARARALTRAAPRVVATLAVLLLAAPGVSVGLILLALPAAPAASGRPPRPPCASARDMRVLRMLPRGTVFAPIDMTPELLVDTDHHAVAGGYHRGAAAIARVITGFTAVPARAEDAVRGSGADYLAVCPGMPEMELYRDIAPGGLWARLERGDRIAWLQPLRVPGPVLAWRVIRPLPDGHSAP